MFMHARAMPMSEAIDADDDVRFAKDLASVLLKNPMLEKAFAEDPDAFTAHMQQVYAYLDSIGALTDEPPTSPSSAQP
jgi:hypothetical protein